MTRRTRCIPGMTIVELTLTLGLTGLLLLGAFQLLSTTRRSECRIEGLVAPGEQAILSLLWLGRDFGQLDGSKGPGAVRIQGNSLALDLKTGQETATATYAFDPGSGALTRGDATGQRSFELGPGSSVSFVTVRPEFAAPGGSKLGRFNNRLEYRILAVDEHSDGRRRVRTLVPLRGCFPLLSKASRDTFPFWNRLP